jgi:hypothetical protein
MTILRKNTRNVVIVLSNTKPNSTEFDVRAAYLSRHVPSIGSHYVVLTDGDIVKGREHKVHGNVDPRWNKNSIFVEVVGMSDSDITPQQRQAVRGIVGRMQDIYDSSIEELDLTY